MFLVNLCVVLADAFFVSLISLISHIWYLHIAAMGLLKLPRYVLEDIVSRLEDAKDIAIAQCVCKELWDVGKHVRTLRFVVLDEYHERLKENVVDVAPRLNIKDQILQCLKGKIGLQQLHIHVEPKLQAKTVPEDRRKTDLWLSDPYFLRKWLPAMKSTLEHLCIVDYGQQAIIRRSSLIKILSQSCKYLFHSFL